MTQTNAQRQQNYRQRHLKATGDDHESLERINMLVHFRAKGNLKRLACHYGVTQRAMLEQIIDEATRRLLDTLDGRQQDDFYDMKQTLPRNEGG